EIDEYEPLPEKGAFRKEYGINEEYIILFLARINKIKGIDILVQAFAELLKEQSSLRLVIIGNDDGYLPTLKEQMQELAIEQNITLTGFVSAEMKVAAYVDAYVYVLPSIYESFGMTVLEACICSTPVVITDRCQIAPLVKDNFGLVVPYDKDRLKEALSEILRDDEMRTRFGETGRTMVREKFSASYCTGQTENLYKQVIEKQNG
ncbi:glycosyltransferase, partial [Chloroflexota bacterium]